MNAQMKTFMLEMVNDLKIEINENESHILKSGNRVAIDSIQDMRVCLGHAHEGLCNGQPLTSMDENGKAILMFLMETLNNQLLDRVNAMDELNPSGDDVNESMRIMATGNMINCCAKELQGME